MRVNKTDSKFEILLCLIALVLLVSMFLKVKEEWPIEKSNLPAPPPEKRNIKLFSQRNPEFALREKIDYWILSSVWSYSVRPLPDFNKTLSLGNPIENTRSYPYLERQPIWEIIKANRNNYYFYLVPLVSDEIVIDFSKKTINYEGTKSKQERYALIRKEKENNEK